MLRVPCGVGDVPCSAKELLAVLLQGSSIFGLFLVRSHHRGLF